MVNAVHSSLASKCRTTSRSRGYGSSMEGQILIQPIRSNSPAKRNQYVCIAVLPFLHFSFFIQHPVSRLLQPRHHPVVQSLGYTYEETFNFPTRSHIQPCHTQYLSSPIHANRPLYRLVRSSSRLNSAEPRDANHKKKKTAASFLMFLGSNAYS